MEMIHYIVEYYFSYNCKWLELKTLSTLSEAEEFLIEEFDKTAVALDKSDDGDMSVEVLMKCWKKNYRITEIEVA
jgi:hypothetical protein